MSLDDLEFREDERAVISAMYVGYRILCVSALVTPLPEDEIIRWERWKKYVLKHLEE